MGKGIGMAGIRTLIDLTINSTPALFSSPVQANPHDLASPPHQSSTGFASG